ncbi:MAG: glycosyltransferase family 39 protein [Candidatus Shapirobacteria bacterium]|nr:glycosyltransferase family 39 protein [Candidatus Shapirobacteria bacterium]
MIKNLHLKSFLWLIPLLVVYFFSRLQNLTQIPVFGDEAIYIRWAQLIKNVETLRFVPLSDGKQPLFMWLNSIDLKFISDPLIAGRLISVLSGAGSLIVIFTFAIYFINCSTALIASILYLTLPFTFFFDRLALADNLLSYFGLLSLFLAFLLAKYPRLDISLILGFSLGLAWLAKSPAIYFIVLSLVTFIIYRLANIKKIYLPLISCCIAFIIYNILRLGPQFHQIALRNLDYIWPLTEVLKHPLDPLIPHLKDIATIYLNYISWPIILVFIFSVFFFRKFIFKNKTILIVFLWWFLPLLTNAGIAKVFTARYILFTVPPLILISSFAISQIKFKYLIIIALSSINIINIIKLSVDSFNYILPPSETGYLSDWTSGWGIKPSADYLISESKTQVYFGTLPDGLQIYTDSLINLTVFGVGVGVNQIPAKLIDARLYGDEVFLLINQTRNKLLSSETDRLELVKSYPKPGSDTLQLYRLR